MLSNIETMRKLTPISCGIELETNLDTCVKSSLVLSNVLFQSVYEETSRIGELNIIPFSPINIREVLLQHKLVTTLLPDYVEGTTDEYSGSVHTHIIPKKDNEVEALATQYVQFFLLPFMSMNYGRGKGYSFRQNEYTRLTFEYSNSRDYISRINNELPNYMISCEHRMNENSPMWVIFIGYVMAIVEELPEHLKDKIDNLINEIHDLESTFIYEEDEYYCEACDSHYCDCEDREVKTNDPYLVNDLIQEVADIVIPILTEGITTMLWNFPKQDRPLAEKVITAYLDADYKELNKIFNETFKDHKHIIGMFEKLQEVADETL